jgi:adenosylcobinamide-GDP ribazoletransferase
MKNMWKREWQIWQQTLMFLTRIRVRVPAEHQPELLQETPRYFPLAGLLIGAYSALIFLLLFRYLDASLAVLGSMLTSIWLTGAFHEDGFADVCDAFGGGWTKEKILAIMKDSRLGTYGVIGLIGILATKYLLISKLPHSQVQEEGLFRYTFIAGILMAAHASSRWMPLLAMQLFDYARENDAPELSKSKPMAQKKPGLRNLSIALVWTALPFFWCGWVYALALPLMATAAWYMGSYFKQWIGGYTGDCLGAIQQVTEIIFYLVSLIIWTYYPG